MRKNFYTILPMLFLVIGLVSCSKDDTKTKEEPLLRVTPPVLANTVRIGTQVWMTRNLNVSRYRNGDMIPQVTDAQLWINQTSGAWCYYQNDTERGREYGKLYNWYAVNDPRGLAPQGYHIPTDSEWNTLATFLGGTSSAGGKMKATGTRQSGTGLWESPNSGATNSSGFTGLPGGVRGGTTFSGVNLGGTWWSTSEDVILQQYASTWNLYYIFQIIEKNTGTLKTVGASVRCIKD